MSKRAAPHRRPVAQTAAERQAPAPDFTPAASTRATGWTPERQTAFIEALAESGCVHEACRVVGLSRQSAYALRMRTDAQGFRLAWDAAIDLAMRRLSDECLSRALNGEVQPVFFQGEQIGERRRYDNRLAMFLLRYRDPLRYAASNDEMVYRGHPEQAALDFARARDRMQAEAHAVSGARANVSGSGEPWQRVELSHARAEQRRAMTPTVDNSPAAARARFDASVAEHKAVYEEFLKQFPHLRNEPNQGGRSVKSVNLAAANDPPPKPKRPPPPGPRVL